MPGENEVSHEDLANAQDEALEDTTAEETQGAGTEEVAPEESTEEVVPEEQVAEPEVQPDLVPEEPEDNATRSNLGRKVKSLEELVAQQAEQTAQLVEALSRNNEPETETTELDPYDPNSLTSFLDQRDAQKSRQQSEYESKARQTMLATGSDYTDEQWIKINSDAEANWTSTGDPVLDAKINFQAAEVRYLKQKVETPINPLSKNTEAAPDGLGSAPRTQNTTQTAAPVTLDEDAAELVKQLGISQDTVDKVLGAKG